MGYWVSYIICLVFYSILPFPCIYHSLPYPTLPCPFLLSLAYSCLIRISMSM